MKTIKDNLMIVKWVFNVSPTYVATVFIADLLFSLLKVIVLYVEKNIISSLTSEIHIIYKIIMFYIIYIMFEYLLSQVIYFLRHFLIEKKEIDIKRIFKNKLFLQVKKIDVWCYEDMEFYNEYQQAAGMIENIGINVIHQISELLHNSIFICFISFALFDPIIILLSFLYAIQYPIRKLKADKVNISIMDETTHLNRNIKYIEDIFSTRTYVTELKMSNYSNTLINKYKNYLINEANIEKKYQVKAYISFIFGYLINYMVLFVMIIYLGYQFMNGYLDTAYFLFLFNSFSFLTDSITDIIKIIPDFKNNRMYIKKINKVMNYKIAVSTLGDNKKIIPSAFNHITFKNVSFHYPNEKDKKILSKIDFTINKGSITAIVGENGSGKSTLIKLLLSLYPCTTGKILYNDICYESYKEESIQNIFGVVFQDFEIFPYTIAENVLMREVKKEKDVDLVWKALEFCGLKDKVNKLDKGIYSYYLPIFDEAGIALSGGEMQKLSIARAYARNCDILIFDEPSSKLDPFSEQEFFNKLLVLGKEVSDNSSNYIVSDMPTAVDIPEIKSSTNYLTVPKEKTILYISHRLSTVKNADTIIVLHEGRIVEKGTHDDLMKCRGKYYDLFLLQAKNYI